MEWVQDPLDTYWYSIMVSAGVLYTQDEGSSPYTSTILEYQLQYALLLELVDMPDLESGAAMRASSSLIAGTTSILQYNEK